MQIFDNILITLITAVITSSVAGVVASRQYLNQKKADLEAEYSSRFNTKKWEVYTEFTSLVRDIVKPFVDPSTAWPDSLHIPQDQFLKIASQIVLIGSDDVVKAFHAWRETGLAHGQAHRETKKKLFELIAEMRRDLGNNYTQLSMEALLGSLDPGS